MMGLNPALDDTSAARLIRENDRGTVEGRPRPLILFHQSFVSDRTPSLVDAAIDSLGAAVGIVLLAWVLRRYRVGRASAPPA